MSLFRPSVVIEGGPYGYPGLVDAFTDCGDSGSRSSSGREGGPRRGAGASKRGAGASGPEDGRLHAVGSGADEVSLSDKRIETWRNGGFTTVVTLAPKGGIFRDSGSARSGWRHAGDLVVKSPVAIPVSFQTSGGFAADFPLDHGCARYVHQVWLDTEWSINAQTVYERTSQRGAAAL